MRLVREVVLPESVDLIGRHRLVLGPVEVARRLIGQVQSAADREHKVICAIECERHFASTEIPPTPPASRSSNRMFLGPPRVSTPNKTPNRSAVLHSEAAQLPDTRMISRNGQPVVHSMRPKTFQAVVIICLLTLFCKKNKVALYKTLVELPYIRTSIFQSWKRSRSTVLTPEAVDNSRAHAESSRG